LGSFSSKLPKLQGSARASARTFSLCGVAKRDLRHDECNRDRPADAA
jgi:hypothetical protein